MSQLAISKAKRSASFLSPKLRLRRKADGRGAFARERLRAGEVLAVWGGWIMRSEKFVTLPDFLKHISLQVEEDVPSAKKLAASI
jgi:hypothetical protein